MSDTPGIPPPPADAGRGEARFRVAVGVMCTNDADRRRSKEAGFDHHLVKPIDPEALERLFSSLRPAAAG